MHDGESVALEVILSLLDRSRTRDGYSDGAALDATIERAINAEKLGYHRFWVAEHHGMPAVASSSPAVLIAAIAAAVRDLPPREVLIAQVLAGFQTPIVGIVNVLQGTIRNAVYVLEAIRKQKESA